MSDSHYSFANCSSANCSSANRVIDLLQVASVDRCEPLVGRRGPQGPVGEQGDDGKQGEHGEEGKRGATGWTGLSVGCLDYASYYTTLDPSSRVLTIRKNDTLSFDSTQVEPRGTYISRNTPDTSEMQATAEPDLQTFVLQRAVYQISWSVPTASAAALTLFVNGAPQTRTTTGSNQSCQITNTILLEVKLEDKILIYNPGQAFDIPTTSDDGTTPLTYNIVIVCIAKLPFL